MITPSEYQRLCEVSEAPAEDARRRMTGLYTHTELPVELPIRLNHAIIGLASEVGELADALKKWIYYGRAFDLDNVQEELGDLLWYISLACNATGSDISQIMEANIAKLKARYPGGFDKSAEAERDKIAEANAMLDAIECDGDN